MSETDLDRIHEFTSLVIASTRSPRQRERLQRALGLSLSETNLDEHTYKSVGLAASSPNAA